MLRVDMNSDLGESFGAYQLGMDEEILQYVTSANVACGWHAGDADCMMKTVRLAKAAGVGVGAHPGYPDLQGFGRRAMALSPDECKNAVLYQVGALKAFCVANGVALQHVKPHGALYNRLAVNYDHALAVCEGIKAVDARLIFLGLAGSEMLRAAREVGLRTASEVFADRAYTDDGTLVPRNMPGAVLHDRERAIARTVRMVKDGLVESVNGKLISIEAQSICTHGDNLSALEFVSSIRAALFEAGALLAPLDEVIG